MSKETCSGCGQSRVICCDVVDGPGVPEPYCVDCCPNKDADDHSELPALERVHAILHDFTGKPCRDDGGWCDARDHAEAIIAALKTPAQSASTGGAEPPQDALGDLRAYGDSESTSALKAKDRDQYQFWQGWVTALDKLRTAAAAMASETRSPKAMSDDFIIGPGGGCPQCYRPYLDCICAETAAQRKRREQQEAEQVLTAQPSAPGEAEPSAPSEPQDALLNPAHQVFFRAGLIACREYMARFVEAESPSIAMSIRANWWPSLGQDFGPPRKLDFSEVTEGEYGTPQFRTRDVLSPTLEALPVALAFLDGPHPAAEPASPGEAERLAAALEKICGADGIADMLTLRKAAALLRQQADELTNKDAIIAEYASLRRLKQAEAQVQRQAEELTRLRAFAGEFAGGQCVEGYCLHCKALAALASPPEAE